MPVEDLKKFAKTDFDIDSILTNANDLKYSRLVKNKLNDWLTSPSEELVRLVATDLVESKTITANIREKLLSWASRSRMSLKWKAESVESI